MHTSYMARCRRRALRIAALATWPATLLNASPALAATPSQAPSPSPSGGLGSTGSGAGYVILAAILIGALIFSTWRLRRDR